MKKILSFISICLILLNFTSFAESTNEYNNIYKATLSEYLRYDMFKEHLKSDKESAMEMIDQITKNRINDSGIKMRSGSMGEAFVSNVQVCPQRDQSYTCGYATTLQTMYGLNLEGTITGNTKHEKELTIERAMGNYGSSAIVYKIRNYLNAAAGASSYQYYEGSTLSESGFANKVAYSLMVNKPVILHAKTGSLNYYNGKNIGHYLSISYINQYTNTVKIVDCNNDTGLGGEHYVPISQAFNTVNIAGRYVISN